MPTPALLPIIFLLGPTASGKTPLAIELVQRYPLEIISVDSAMVYKGMDIGTAKPTALELAIAPHHLIDIRDPSQSYSVGQFVRDAKIAIDIILQKGKIPFFVGGTMMYFNALQRGLSLLPLANPSIRQQLLEEASEVGWPALHKQLSKIDPEAAKRIHAHDQQRIQRALEVYRVTGKTITAWQQQNISPLANYRIYASAITVSDRKILHERIATRFNLMLAHGLLEEVKTLYARGDLHAGLSALRAVGYRKVWAYLAGEIDFNTMQEQTIAATRQLAKRQLTWLRNWQNLTWFLSDKQNMNVDIYAWVDQILGS